MKTGKFLNAGLRVRVEDTDQLGIVSVNEMTVIDDSGKYFDTYDVNLDDGTRLDGVKVRWVYHYRYHSR